ncbi:MAG: O-antigen ligase family protein [Lachnospiraceae bacterium]
MNLCERVRYQVTWYYFALIFSVLPLFFVNMYFNISQEKWLCFILCSVVYFFIMVVSYIFDDNGLTHLKSLFKKWGITEYAMLVFLIVTIISTIFSADPFSSLTGDEARYNGLSNIIAYFLIFILARRYHYNNKPLVILLCGIGALVSITAVCQYLTWDPIGMYNGVTVQSVHRMISTIGNRNIYASFLSMILPLTIYLYISGDTLKRRVIYGIFLAIGFAGAMAGNSDSVYIGVTAGLIIMISAGGLSATNLKRITGALAWAGLGDYLILTAAHILRNKGADIRPSQGITAYFTNHTSYLLIIFLILAAISVLMNCFHKAQITDKPAFGKKFRIASTSVLITGITGFFIWVAASFPFPDEFGSFRGFIWRLAMKDFSHLPTFKKLFGYGPETLLNIYNQKYHDEMIDITGVIYDNVHCEPMEYLVTTGILGFAAYMILVVSLIVRLYKATAHDKNCYLYLIPVFAYFAQSFVNIAQSATTPLFFILMAMGSGCLQPEKVTRLCAEDEFTAEELLED